MSFNIIGLTKPEQDFLAHILAVSLRQYGWEDFDSIDMNRVDIHEQVVDEKTYIIISTIANEGLILLRTEATGDEFDGKLPKFVELTEKGVPLAREYYNAIHVLDYDKMVAVANANRAKKALKAA